MDEKDAERNVSNVERKEQLALGHSVEVGKKHLLYNRKKQSRLWDKDKSFDCRVLVNALASRCIKIKPE